MFDLAIVIPAYKIDFFDKTLKSIANQTCKDFTLYIGDDCSQHDFLSVVDKYKSIIDIRYHYFDNNLGGKDLVAQWERCIALTHGEKWIWLFSDDDVMSPDCVSRFYNEADKGLFDLYHFDVNVIDASDRVVRKSNRFPDVIQGEQLYRKKESARLDSFVVEYIFSRHAYNNIGGFVKFDMAWGSDTATWIALAGKKGVKTISGAVVEWRQSDLNITPDTSKEVVQKKLSLEVDYLYWAASFFPSGNLKFYNKYLLFRKLFHYSDILSSRQLLVPLGKAYEYHIIGRGLCFLLSHSICLISFLKKVKLTISNL